MTATHAVLYVWAYFLGLLLSAYDQSVLGIPIGAIALFGTGCLAAAIVPRYWRTGLTIKGWLIVGLIGCVAVLYCEMRSPQPSDTDISTLLQDLNQPSATVVVDGQIESAPRQTRSQNQQFWLRVTNAALKEDTASNSTRPKSGKLYVTVSAKEASTLEPGQGVRLTGTLYPPKAATNPGSFDFKRFLERQGCFAGLRASEVVGLEPDWSPGRWLALQGQVSHRLWLVRERINRAFAKRIQDPDEAALISGMVLGKKAVDLPPDISDAFAQAGMAHTMAASGFHVSLLLGMVMWFTRGLIPSHQAWIGISVVLGYIGLTGAQPSVLRAGLMGIGALLGKAYEQKLRPVGVLLVVAFVLLLINPLWMFHLGFQLSFLATLGLLVTAPPLAKALDWLPSSIATAIAIPISAYIWTLPVQLLTFGTVSTYSILVNMLTTPLVTVISLGGMVCAAIALVSPEAGSWVVWPLQFLARLLIYAVEGFNALPGSVYAVGAISIVQVVLLYGLFGWVWWQSKWRILPWFAGGLAIALIFMPTRLYAVTQSPITFLNTAAESVVVVRHRGEVGLIHSGSEADIQFTVLPFLKQQGVNRIDWAIASRVDSGSQTRWQQIANDIPITTLVPIQSQLSNSVVLHGVQRVTPIEIQQSVRIGSADLTVLSTIPEVVSYTLGDRTWLMVQSEDVKQAQMLSTLNWPQAEVLQWSGDTIPAGVMHHVAPTIVIGTDAAKIESDRASVPIYALKDDGAVQWNAGQQPHIMSHSSGFD